jgi:hypothetical protein
MNEQELHIVKTGDSAFFVLCIKQFQKGFETVLLTQGHPLGKTQRQRTVCL